MAQYRVTLPDGTQYKISAPEGTSEAAIRAAAQQYAAEERYRSSLSRLEELRRPAPPTPAPPKETTFGGNIAEFFKGLAPGAVGLGETAATGLAALLPDETERAVRGKVGELAQAARAPLAAEAGYEESVGRKLGEALGSTIPFFALRGRTGAGIGAGVGVSAGAGEARQAAEAAGATEEQRRLATALGAPTGLLDILAPNIGPMKSMITTALARGGIEGATEAAQKISQNLIARGVYNPEQDVLAGSGEEGAYGAGAGALASLLLDVTLGRRARQAPATQAQAQAQAQTQALAPTPPEAPATGLMAAIPPSAQFPQGELFRQDITRARAQQAPVVEEGRPEFALTPPEPTAEQMELPFGALAAEPAVAAPQQRDLIDELETAQIREMQDQDETQQIQAMLAEDAKRAEAERAKQERLKFESDLAETDARRMEAERKKTEDHRLEILRTIIEEPSVKNIQATFGDALKIAGYTDTNFTPRERQMIDRANDVRGIKPEEPVPSAPADLGTMEALIPERREAREPQQLGFPGIGKREVRPAEEAPIPEAQAPGPGMPSTQVEMFGPRGGVLAPVKETRRADLRTQPVGTGTSVAPVQATVPSGGVQPAPGDTGVAQASQPPGLGVSGEPAPQPDVGEAAAPTPVARDYAEQVLARYNGLPEAQRDAVATRLGMTRPQIIESEAIFNRTKEVDDAITEVTKPAAPAPAPAPASRKKITLPSKPKVKLPTVQEEGTAGYMLYAKGDKDKALDVLAHDMALAMYPEKNVAKTMNAIMLDLRSGKIPNPKFGKPETYAPYTGGKFAKGFFDSLSLEDYKTLVGKLEATLTDYARTEERNNTLDKLVSLRKAEEALQSEQTKLGLNLETPVLGLPLHPAIQDKLRAGDLIGALTTMSKIADGRLSSMAAKIAANMGATKVVMSDNVVNEAGRPVAGRYDPQTDTIYMNTSMGMSGHVLMHEAAHAVTSHVLDNKSHPVTKQLTALYESAKPYLDTVYGSRSLDEFVAEAFSNPRFQEQLAGIPAQGNATIWQRFVNTVQNFVRRMMGMDARPVESTLDATDRLVTEIMSPAPAFRGAGSLYAAAATGQAGRTLDIYGAHAMQAPTWSKEVMYKVREFLGRSPKDMAANLYRQALPLNALVDTAKERIPQADEIGKLVDERAGAENRRNQKIDAVAKYVQDWAQSNEMKLDNLNSVIYNSTYYQVDPAKPRSDYLDAKGKPKLDKDGNNLAEVWDMLAPKWNALGEDGRSIYNTMRNTYKNLHDDVWRVLSDRITAAMGNTEAANRVKQDVYTRLFERGRIEPYFPLTRSGKYWLAYHADGELYVEAFETDGMREDAIKALNAAGGVTEIQKFANVSQINYRNAPSTSFVNSILKTLDAGKIGADANTKEKINEVTEEVMNLFLSVLPETSFAQGMRRRKNTLGFQQDAVYALRGKALNISRQLANIEYGAKLERVRSEMREHVKKEGNQEADVAYMDELDQRINYAISPNVHWMSRAATSFGFAWTLGFNVSSALVNLAQIPIVVTPYYGARYGYPQTTAALGRAAKIFSGSGLSRETEMLVPVTDDKGNTVMKALKVPAMPSIDNYDFSDPKNAKLKHLETLVKIAGDRGQLNRSISYDILEAFEGDSILTRANRAMGAFFHHGERMNRQVALVSAYELELDRLKNPNAKLEDGRRAGDLNEKQREEYAANHAIYLAEMTNGGTAAAAAPRLMQSNLGRVAFMYKRYGVSMYYMMFKTARQMMQNEDPQVKYIAFKQLAGIAGAAGLMSGVRGLPMFGTIAMLYNLFLAGDDEDDFETLVRKYFGETAYGGLIDAFTGLAVGSRMGLSDLLFRDMSTKEHNSIYHQLAEMMGGPVVGVGMRMERGVKLINEGHYQRGFEQLMPSAFSNFSKVERFATEGALTLRGDPVTSEFSTTQLVGQALGFAPASYIYELEKNTAGKRIERATLEERTKLLRNYYIAKRNGDEAGAAEVKAKMEDFNKRHPDPKIRISAETVRNSMAQHIQTSKEMVSGVLFSKSMRAELLRNRAEFDGPEDEIEEE